MTVKELIDQLTLLKDMNGNVSVNVMSGEDDGIDEEFYEIRFIQAYEDGSVQIKV